LHTPTQQTLPHADNVHRTQFGRIFNATFVQMGPLNCLTREFDVVLCYVVSKVEVSSTAAKNFFRRHVFCIMSLKYKKMKIFISPHNGRNIQQ